MKFAKFFGSYTHKKLVTMGTGWLREVVFIFGAIFLLILLRPFGLNQEEFLSSAVYWALICLVGFGVFSLTYWFGRKILTPMKQGNLPAFIAVTFVAGLIMTMLVPFFSSLYFGHPLTYFNGILIVLPQMAVICAIIIVLTMTRNYIANQNSQIEHHETHALKRGTQPEFMKKIPRKLQGDIICVTAEDHYIHVHTDKGRHMLKMKFSDALQELEYQQGLRVHRSWWVSENAVVEASRSGRKYSLQLTNDVRVPVSSAHLTQVKKRGLL